MIKINKAFTMIELIFIIVIIGIISSIAIPKLSSNQSKAVITKAKSTLAAVRSSISIERNRRILTGNFKTISNLGDVFTHFDTDTKDYILQYGISKCDNNASLGCWKQDTNTTYSYIFPIDGVATFKLTNNRLICDGNLTDCKRLEN